MIRGLTPDDLKRDAETHTEDGAVKAARFLTLVSEPAKEAFAREDSGGSNLRVFQPRMNVRKRRHLRRFK